jgi:hypothetical protein
MVASKIVLYAMCICFGVAAVCFLFLIALTFVYGDVKTITTDPNHPGLEKGWGRYMDEASYQRYRNTIGPVHYVCWLSGVLGIALYLVYSFLESKSVG